MAIPLDINKITICLEQKILFITIIYDTTKQIEVKSQQEEIELQEVLNNRENSITRIDKCDKLIDMVINESDDEQAKSIVKQLISNPKDIDIEKLEEPYLNVGKLIVKYVSILKDTIELDKVATAVTRARYNDVKEKLSKLRNPANRKNMFNV